MSLRHLANLRQFSTCRTLRLPVLSDTYRSGTLWQDRFKCHLLSGDSNMVRSINSKIYMDQKLNSLELDIFTNIARPGDDQLRESVKILKAFRMSPYAHTIMPSTPHAICRLFLDSQRLSALVLLLEDRINYGVFPDFFALNLLLDAAIDGEKYALASRIASFVMLQEEFGINPITDALALAAITKYIDSKTDFNDWSLANASNDPILADKLEDKAAESKEKSKEDEENDDEEEDIEYIRIPFLRNPFFDNHFDLTNPRLICGKTFSMMGNSFMKSGDDNLGIRCRFMGSLLQGKWSTALELLVNCKTNLGPIEETSKFYLENLNELTAPTDAERASLLLALKNVSKGGQAMSELVEDKCRSVKQYETQDIEQFKQNIVKWSERRIATKKALEEREVRMKLIEEIKAKKLELEQKEQYLYFYDNLKKSRLTRLDYN